MTALAMGITDPMNMTDDQVARGQAEAASTRAGPVPHLRALRLRHGQPVQVRRGRPLRRRAAAPPTQIDRTTAVDVVVGGARRRARCPGCAVWASAPRRENVDAAYAFINHYLSPETQAIDRRPRLRDHEHRRPSRSSADEHRDTADPTMLDGRDRRDRAGQRQGVGRGLAGDPRPGERYRARVGDSLAITLLALVLVVLVGPILLLAVFSFNDSSIIALPFEGFTTASGTRRRSPTPTCSTRCATRSCSASVVAPVCVVLGTATAWGITRFRFRGRGVWSGLVGAPLVVPWLVIGVAG